MSRMNNKIAKYRKKAQLTQVQLARKAGVGQSQISHWENGGQISLPSIKKLAEALGISPRVLL
jgi:transcriptional regulator with XRE-family HTH domain